MREHPEQQMLIAEIGMTQTVAFDLRQPPPGRPEGVTRR